MNLKEQQESTKGIIDNIIRELLRARRTAGLTQKELSSRTGIAQSDISKLERGIGNPSLKTLARLAEGMDLHLSLTFMPKKAE
ncbi:MAG TPA: transcriptional regulator [Erysipelotrichaceae bacterium]|nr:transcriptional regulator [Erysipelotrichaceae bacterium]